ncbi:MAG TPA: hypothetical protein VFE51_09135 [Verrucomicrobiae bacterium]|nr:hypothetical protein [Verrucomicrobiae bacterium]
MSSLKQLKHEEKHIALQRQAIAELNAIARDIERSEKTILALNHELQAVNAKYQGPRNTREDVAYLTGLLECAKKKLAWEKQISSLQKRTPSLMERMGALMTDPQAPPSPELREQMLKALQAIQAAMERLQAANGGTVAQASSPAG